MTEFLQVGLNCLVLSANYILLALGLTLIFGILRVLNFAHGTFYICGAYVVYALVQQAGFHYFPAALTAMIVIGGLGIFIEAVILYPLSEKVKVASLGAILGVSMILEGSLAFIFEGEDVSIGSQFKGILTIWGATLSRERLMVVLLCGLIVIGLYIWIRRTRQGIAIRALAENPRVAALQGINIRFMRFLVMGVASFLAAAAGAIVTPLFYINPFMGGGIIFKALLIVAVGGMGSIEGSILAGLLIGCVESIGVTYLGPVAEVASFLIVIAIFLFRPQGLLGVEYEFH
jgi:branched-chain amino acid transport system permease protein